MTPTPSRMARVAVAQAQPSPLDVTASIRTVVEKIDEAAHAGAELVVFPEAFAPGYPAWLWKIPPVMFKDSDPADRAAAHLMNDLRAAQLRNAIVIDRDLEEVRAMALDRGTVVVLGVQERDLASSRGSLYNTVVTIDSDGSIVNRHRKLMPTGPERLEWARGDASGLRVAETDVGRIGSLICWENYMPLARFALQSEGPDIHAAPTWDSGEKWLASMRHIALEGRCWVISAGAAMRRSDLLAAVPELTPYYAEAAEWINPGDSVIISPTGDIVGAPLHEQYGLLIADIDLNVAQQAKRSLDVAGHYSRPDVFGFTVDRRSQPVATFTD